jgi:uncharacterized DUF497 family protein
MAEENDLSRLFANATSFEWDENKRRLNVFKHGIDFVDAKDVFYDPAAYTFLSPQTAGEQRCVTVGSMRGVLIAVVSTRRGAAIRIISARSARRNERQRYGAEGQKQTR